MTSGTSWTPSSTNGALVDALISASHIPSNSRVETALRATDRAIFAPNLPYVDAATPLPHHPNTLVTAPAAAAAVLSVVAHRLRPGAAVLDVGAGSGYLTAAFARLVGPAGVVVGVEICPSLVSSARASVHTAAAGVPQNVRIMQGDGRLGAPAFAPFDVIYVGAAADDIPPALRHQLAPGGRLLVAVGPAGGEQILTVVDKGPDGGYATTRAMNVRYVPELRAADDDTHHHHVQPGGGRGGGHRRGRGFGMGGGVGVGGYRHRF